MSAIELNLDGIVGPTHNYAGLSSGNLASTRNSGTESNPKAAALEGLAKMKIIAGLGVPQAVFPPQHRPDITFLRALGFRGSDEFVLEKASKEAPELLAAATSASSMWMANAATVSPSADTGDGRVHITPANLTSQLHRSIEPQTTARLLRSIFPDETHFAHHDPLPGSYHLSDEGAANHLRLCTSHSERGEAGDFRSAGVEGHDASLEVFVYGRDRRSNASPKRFAARQSLEACRTIARHHGLISALFLQQNPDTIDQGAFHNDVVAVSNQNTLFIHESAFADPAETIASIRNSLSQPDALHLISVSEDELSLEVAIETYLFNSQLVALPDGETCLVAPGQCERNENVSVLIDRIVSDEGFDRVEFVDIRESMRNGGGPACLRLRVVLTEKELAAMHQGVLLYGHAVRTPGQLGPRGTTAIGSGLTT